MLGMDYSVGRKPWLTHRRQQTTKVSNSIGETISKDFSHYFGFIFFFLKSATNKLHFSMENLSKPNASSSTSTSPASSFMSSRSCDSIYRPKNNKIAPKLPVAQNTARLLDRVNHSTNKNDDSAMRGTPVQK